MTLKFWAYPSAPRRVLTQDGQTPFCADRCCCLPEPAECPYSNTSEGPETLQIKDYSDGDIPYCSDVDCNDSTATAWSGKFSRDDICKWSLEAHTTGDRSIDGAELQTFESSSALVLFTDNQWEIRITCKYQLGYDDEFMWHGIKNTGNSPIGTYEAATDSQCGPSSFYIEEV